MGTPTRARCGFASPAGLVHGARYARLGPAGARCTARRVRVARARVSMLGPMPFGGGGAFFESPIIRDEAERLERDHKALAELGKGYGRFDRDGKLQYVAALEDIMDRWLIMLKRFELADSFQCRMYVTHMKSELSKHGLTIETLTANSRESLNQMRREAEREMPPF